MSGENEFYDTDTIPMSEVNEEEPTEETEEEYGDTSEFEDPPGVPAPPDLEDQNGEEGDDA